MWIEKILNLKFVGLVVSLLLWLAGIAAVGFAGYELFMSILILIGYQEGAPGASIIQSIDTFLFALVIFILAAGIYKLFSGNENTFQNTLVFAEIKTFTDLKSLLWKTILLTLTVWSALGFLTNPEQSAYEELILPVSIVLLAIAYKLVKSTK